MRTYERLGEDKPHNPAGDAAVKKDEADGESKNPPLSPTDTGLDETRQTIDVKADESQDKPKGSITAADDKTEVTAVVAATTEPPAQTETPVRKKRSKASDAAAAKEKAAKPYLGLFSASLKMDFSPPLIEIADLREGVGGGDKSWTEPLRCIICDSLIN